MQQVEVFNLGELTERLLILQGRSSDEVWAEEKNALFRQLERAAASQKLRVRHPETMLPEVFAEWAPPSSGCLVSTIADVNAWLVSEGVPYSMTPLPDSTAAQPQAVPVEAPADSASGGVSWTLAKPLQFQGYRKPLHDLLRAAHIAGQPRPTARDVLEAWREKTPLEVAKVLADSLDSYDIRGNTKAVSLEAIRKTIGRMTR